ncbi:hypothetical protein OfM1_08230 [Lactovum odontotermitis]
MSTLAVPSIVAQADVASDAVSAASSANSDASAANETASQISGESNVASQSSLVSQLSSQASDFVSSASSSIPTISSAIASGSATASGTVDSYSSAVDSYSSAMSSYLSSASDTVAENTKNSGILIASQAASEAYNSYSNAVASMNSAEENLSSAVSNAQSLVDKMNSGVLTAAETASLSAISQSYAQYVSDLQSSMAAVSASESSYFEAVSSLQALDSSASITGEYLVVDSATGSSLASASDEASAYLDSLDVMSTGSLIALAADYAAASSAQSSTASLAASFGSVANSTALSMNDQQNGALSMASSYYTAGNYGSAAELMNSYYSMAQAAPSVFDSLATSFASLQNSLSVAIESYNTLGSTFNAAASQAASDGFISSYTPMILIASTAAGQLNEALATDNPNYQILLIDVQLARWTGFYMDGTSEVEGIVNSIFQEFFTENNTKNTKQWSETLKGTAGQWDASSFNPFNMPDFTQAQVVTGNEVVTLSTWGGQVTVTADFPTGEYVKVNPILSSVSMVSLDTPPTAPTIAVTPVAAVANEPSIDIEKSSKPIGEPGDGNHGDTDNNIGTGDADTTSTSEDLSAGKTIYFRVTNNGSQALANIKVSDSQLMGSKMVTGITWTFNGAALTIGEDGFFYLDGVLLVLQPGEAVYGQGQIDAAPAGETEGDEAAVTANPVNPDGTIDTSKTVGDEDKWYGKTNSESPANGPVAPDSPSAPNTPAQTPVSYSPAVKTAPENPVSGHSEKQLPETGEGTNKTMLLAGFITLGTAMVLAYGGSERKKHLMKLVLNAKHHQL